MKPDQEKETETSAELGRQLKALDEKINQHWEKVLELRKLRPALLARIIALKYPKE